MTGFLYQLGSGARTRFTKKAIQAASTTFRKTVDAVHAIGLFKDYSCSDVSDVRKLMLDIIDVDCSNICRATQELIIKQYESLDTHVREMLPKIIQKEIEEMIE